MVVANRLIVQSKDKNSSGDEVAIDERELLRSAPGSYPNSLK